MPIMAANAESDARGAAWLLASAARQCIDDPGRAPEWRDALNNTYRLLDAFRQNVFFGLRPPRLHRHVRGDVETLTMVPSSDRHLSELREAMESALALSFSSASKEVAVEKIATVLRAVVEPTRFQASEEDKNKASLFFNELLKRLAEG
jgi:hypothetical protein